MGHLKRKDYEAALEPLQRELVRLARWAAGDRARASSVLFEGRDSAGKGGAIEAIRQHLNPRQVTHVALAKPTEREDGQWYFQRYVAHLPAAGEIVLFDRSWYNRAGVEEVMGFATPDRGRGVPRRRAGVREAADRRRHPAVQILADCDQDKQEERFAERRRGSAQGLETVADRCRRARQVRRLHRARARPC